jgi:hypothetical protein
VCGWRPGEQLPGALEKVQDVFVDAKVPRSDRELAAVVRGDEVVAVPGIVEVRRRGGERSVSDTEPNAPSVKSCRRGRVAGADPELGAEVSSD